MNGGSRTGSKALMATAFSIIAAGRIFGATVDIGDSSSARGGFANVGVDISSTAAASMIMVRVHWDASKLSDPQVTSGPLLSANQTLYTYKPGAGLLNLLVHGNGNPLPLTNGNSGRLALLGFRVLPNAPTGPTKVDFTVLDAGLIPPSEILSAGGVDIAGSPSAGLVSVNSTPYAVRQADDLTSDVRNTTAIDGWAILGEGRYPPETGTETDNSYHSVFSALQATTNMYGGNPTHFRVTGWQSQKNEWIPWTSITSNNYVRAKYYVYAADVQNPGVGNQIPNMRFRVAARFAQTALLEILHHQNADNDDNATGELRPSLDPTNPSLYRVDFAPVFVPALNIGGEGAMRAFENYCLDPQNNGTIGMTESVIGQYPKTAIPDSMPALKIYQTSSSDSGDLKRPGSDPPDTSHSLILSSNAGEFASADTTALSTISDSSSGVMFDTSQVNKSPGGGITRVVQASREFFPGSDQAARVRVEADTLYKIRYHVTSLRQSNKMPQIRPRVHTIKFGYTQKFEVGGALNTGSGKQSVGNNLIALQALPGIGTQNPDKISTENGGWYTIILNTPIATDMNPQNPTQGWINLEPGPGVNVAGSKRDIKCAFDLIDSLDTNDAALQWERGVATVDKIEVRSYPQIAD